MTFLLIIFSTVTLTLAAEESELLVSNANTKFGNSFYKALAKDYAGEDLFFSPFGVHAALSMLYQGAGNTTKNALTSTLHLSDPATAAEGYSHIIDNLNNVENVTLHIANRIYVTQNFSLLPDYDNVLQEKFRTQVEQVDFGKSKEAADVVNSWVKKKTGGKIPHMFDEGDFSRDTRVVLVNAIYFKGGWRQEFEKGHTKTEPFFITDSRKTEVQMMHQQGGFNYKNDFELEAEVLEMTFVDDSVNMYIILPFEKYGIAGLEERMQKYGVEQIFKGLQFDDALYVSIPKFRLETTIDLVDPLRNLGLDSLFSEGECNLSKVAKSDGNLYVSKAIQKAFFEITEEGAEAAAATGMFLIDRDLRTPVQFYANHPFLVILKQANNILFYGRIMQPVSGTSELAPSAEPTYHELNALRFRCIQCQQAVQGQCDMCIKIDWTSFSSEGA